MAPGKSGGLMVLRRMEFVADAYDSILEAEAAGLLSILRYEETSDKMREWIAKTIQNEYEEASAYPEYRHFLKGCFTISP